jgi:lipopolysaccharide transport system ATP-binding protein
MLNGLIKPDRGTITMRGRSLRSGPGSLDSRLWTLVISSHQWLRARAHEKGTGAPGGAEEGCRRQARRASRFGKSANQIDEKIDEIIDFAEIREFIDMPVQSYSSGRALSAEV